jgi:hypothetical protein
MQHGAYATRTFRTYKYRLTYKDVDGKNVSRLFLDRADLGEFVGVSTNTICRWLNGKTQMEVLMKYRLDKVRIPARTHIERTCVEKSATLSGYADPNELPPPAV